MLPDFNTSPSLPMGSDAAWHEVITNAITRPSPAVFQAISPMPGATTFRAVKWVALGALGGYFIKMIVTIISVGWNWLLLAGVVLFPIAACVVFLGITSTTHWLGNKLGQPTQYDHFAFACAAFYTPYFVFAVCFLDRRSYWLSRRTG